MHCPQQQECTTSNNGIHSRCECKDEPQVIDTQDDNGPIESANDGRHDEPMTTTVPLKEWRLRLKNQREQKIPLLMMELVHTDDVATASFLAHLKGKF